MTKLFVYFRNKLFKKIRSRNKDVLVTSRLSNYIEDFVVGGESKEMRGFWRYSKSLEWSDMQSPAGQVRFLSLLTRAINAKNVLELGTFRGYATVHLATGVSDDGKVITCEASLERVPEAREAFKKLGLENKIELIHGKARDIMERFIGEERKFDLIFIDADKANYQHYFEQALKLIRSKGVILIDNTLWAGLVAFENPGDKVGVAMREFNSFIFKKMSDRAVILPVWDGLTMVVAE